MSVLVDNRAREMIRRREERGKPASIALRAEPLLHGGYTLAADWVENDTDGRAAADGRERAAVVQVDQRIARYARWNDVTISAQWIGPLGFLTVGDPLVLYKVGEWEREHPGLVAPHR